MEALKLRPLQAGWLRVTGVEWILNGTALGAAAFDIRGKKRKRPKGTRPGQVRGCVTRMLMSFVPTCGGV